MSTFDSNSFNILAKQKDQVKLMLNLQCSSDNNNNNNNNDNDNNSAWKIIIYDEYCGEILATLFSEEELQSYGITLYLLISSCRDQIPCVPAIYFIFPSISTIDYIISDISLTPSLYNSYYLNFSSGLNRNNLEYLANNLIRTNSYNRISAIYDQYINYISLSPNLFTLNINNCYSLLHSVSATVSDNTICDIINNIVQSLFCVIVSLQLIPIIRVQSSNCASKQIAQLLNNKISTHLKDKNNNLFTKSGMSIYQNRPLLIILERSVDFAIALHHSPIYQSFLHDLLDFKLNRVTATYSVNNNIKKERIFLDYLSDEFWKNNSLKPFPFVYESHHKLLNWFIEKENEITNKDNNDNDNDEYKYDNNNNNNQSTHDLIKQTITSLPQLLQKKKEIDKHTRLLSNLAEILQARGISDYFHLEESLMHYNILDNKQLSTLFKKLSNNSSGNIEDKLRLFLIYYLCNNNNSNISKLKKEILTNNDVTSYINNDNTISSLQYIIEHKKFLNLGKSLKNNINDDDDNDNNDNKDNNNNNKSSGLSSWSWFGNQSKNVLNQLRGMLPTSGKCTITRITKLLMNTDITSIVTSKSMNTFQSNPHLKNIDQNYMTFDPLNSNNNININNIEYNRSIVFMVGGGSFAEYSNLNEFAIKKNKNIIYGCTDLVTPNDFLTQLSNLGKK